MARCSLRIALGVIPFLLLQGFRLLRTATTRARGRCKTNGGQHIHHSYTLLKCESTEDVPIFPGEFNAIGNPLCGQGRYICRSG